MNFDLPNNIVYPVLSEKSTVLYICKLWIDWRSDKLYNPASLSLKDISSLPELIQLKQLPSNIFLFAERICIQMAPYRKSSHGRTSLPWEILCSAYLIELSCWEICPSGFEADARRWRIMREDKLEWRTRCNLYVCKAFNSARMLSVEKHSHT